MSGGLDGQAAHPQLTESKDLQSFLESTEEDWARLMAQYETSGSSKTLGNTLQLFRNVQRSAVNLVYSKSDDEEEDDEYLKVRSRASIALGCPCLRCLPFGTWTRQ